METKNNVEQKAPEKITRTYSLASREARCLYDLTMYEDIIVSTVQSVIPGVKVSVHKDSYTVYGISKGEAIIIGRLLSQYFRGAALAKAVIFVSTPGEIFSEQDLYYQQDNAGKQ